MHLIEPENDRLKTDSRRRYKKKVGEKTKPSNFGEILAKWLEVDLSEHSRASPGVERINAGREANCGLIAAKKTVGQVVIDC